MMREHRETRSGEAVFDRPSLAGASGSESLRLDGHRNGYGFGDGGAHFDVDSGLQRVAGQAGAIDLDLQRGVVAGAGGPGAGDGGIVGMDASDVDRLIGGRPQAHEPGRERPSGGGDEA